jgi:hypothetical protein
MAEARFRFRGTLRASSFRAFAEARAARLGVTLHALDVGVASAEARVEGEEALLGMFEMACALGPLDCLVIEAERAP